MRKLLVVAGLAFIPLALWAAGSAAGWFPRTDVLGPTLRATGANLEQVQVTGWTWMTENTSLEEGEAGRVAASVAEELGAIDPGARKTAHRDGPVPESTVVYENGGTRVVATVRSYPPGAGQAKGTGQAAGRRPLNGDQWRNLVAGSLTSRAADFSWENARDGLGKALARFGGSAPGPAWQRPRIYVIMTGAIPGRAAWEARRTLAAEALKAAGATRVEGIDEPDLLSVSAHTRRISGGLSVGGKRVNLNVAFRYDEKADRTVVIVGSPLIAAEY